MWPIGQWLNKSRIFNSCIEQSFVTNDWKNAFISRRYKGIVKSRRLDSGLLSETHETLFSSSILIRSKANENTNL